MSDLEKRLRGCPCVCHYGKGQRCPCCDSCVEAAETLAAVREWAEDGIRRYGGVSPWHAEVLAILDRSDADVEVGT